MKTNSLFERYALDRRRKKLPWGARWLTLDDIWQNGDQYDLGRGNWVTIGTRHTGMKAGTPVQAGSLCYTPRGSKKRQYTQETSKSKMVRVMLFASAMNPIVFILTFYAWFHGWNYRPGFVAMAILALITSLPGMLMTLKGIRRIRAER